MTTPHDDRESVREAVSDEARRLLPWAVSILMHLGLVILAVFLVWSTLTPEEEVHGDTTGWVDHVPTFAMPKLDRTFEPKPRTGGRTIPSPNQTTALVSTVQSIAKPVNVIGLGTPAAAAFHPIEGQSNDPGPVFDIKPADRIVFVIDASGSLIDTLPFVQRELQRTIAQELSDEHQFTVLFFRGGLDRSPQVVELPPAGYKRATADVKAAAMTWLDPQANHVVPMGKTNPLAALKQAMAMRPDAVYLLSDNITGRGLWELSQAQLLRDIAGLNRHRASIHTIQFIYPDPLGTLERIAAEHRGRYRFVDGRELALRQ